MTRNALYKALCDCIPASYSEVWDNDGAMLLPDGEGEVSHVLCTLDVSDSVVDYAIENGFDLILSHHPLIFSPLRALNGEDAVSRRVLRLLSNNIAVFSFHTRLDAMEGGINDVLAKMLGVCAVKPLGEGEAALGRVGNLNAPMSLDGFLSRVKRMTDAPILNVLKKTDTVSRIAIVGGEGKDFIEAATKADADTYLSGRLGYHAMLDGEINLIECGHYFSEKHAAALLKDLVASAADGIKAEIYTPNSLAVY